MTENQEQTNSPQQGESIKNKNKNNKTGFYYSFLTLVLLLCLVQIGFGAILNISKTISYKAKISTLTKIRDNAENKNQELKQDIKLFSSTTSLEGIARNNLKMAGEDEILVLINNNQTQQPKKNKKFQIPWKNRHKK